MSEEELINWTVVSGFGHNTQRPFVEIIIRPHEVQTQMSPATARELAQNLLYAADAAESDAFLVTFMRQRIGVKDAKIIAGILMDFRKWRDEQAMEGGES